MGHHHGHGHAHAHGHAPAAAPGGDEAARLRARRALAVVLALTAGFAVAEIIGGFVAGSVALLADAAHMLSDAGSIALALGALWLAGRPATARLSFGWRRAEILAALINGVTLVAIGIWVIVEAAGRLGDAPDVEGGTTLVIGVIGLGVNIAAAGILWRTGGHSLNVRAALMHVLADLAGSLGVITAAVVIITTGWMPIDPILGIAIGLLVLVGSWRVLRESVAVLLEATPEGIDGDEVGRRMAAIEGVRDVHDLHIWTITSGFAALAAHVTADPGRDCQELRRVIAAMLVREFGITHTTLQVEPAGPERRLYPVSAT
jgi:cobalt-zinc-cadmium efflux system protein